MRIRTLAVLLLAGLGLAPLRAQTPGARGPWEASLAAILATADARKISNGSNPNGMVLGFGFRGELYPGLGSRLHLGFLSFGGKEGSGLENRNRLHPTFGWDLMKQYGQVALFGGFTGTQFRQAVLSSDPNFSGANRAEGVKLGLRIGGEYVLGGGFSAQLSFNHTEFNRKFNPSWVGVGAVYRFRAKP